MASSLAPPFSAPGRRGVRSTTIRFTRLD